MSSLKLKTSDNQESSSSEKKNMLLKTSNNQESSSSEKKNMATLKTPDNQESSTSEEKKNMETLKTSDNQESSSSDKKKNMVTLKTSDNQEFEVEESVAVRSVTIKNMVEDDYGTIPLPNVTGECLAMIIVYLKKHADSKVSEDDLEKFDSEFVDKPMSDLFNIVLAANYLEIKDLIDILCTKIANSITDKSVEEVRTTFNVTNDYTPEEEREVREENAWAFE